MVDELHGHVVSIRTKYESATLTASAASGATVIYVNDVADFDETGGSLRIADSTGTFLAAQDYTAIDDDADSITLASGLAAAIPSGAEVRALAADGNYAQTAEADVVDDSDGSPITVDVLHGLIRLLSNSVRAGTQESVVCTRDASGKWTLVDVLGRRAVPAAPHARRDRATNYTVANSTETTLPWDSSPATRGGMSVSSGVWTVPTDGRYMVTASVQFDANATGIRRLRLQLNGAITGALMRVNADASGGTALCVSQVLDLSAGDQITVMVYQTSGAGLDVLADSTATITGLD